MVGEDKLCHISTLAPVYCDVRERLLSKLTEYKHHCTDERDEAQSRFLAGL